MKTIHVEIHNSTAPVIQKGAHRLLTMPISIHNGFTFSFIVQAKDDTYLKKTVLNIKVLINFIKWQH